MSVTEPTIYIVDDDEAIRRSLSLVMRAARYNAVACESAQSFLESCDDSSGGCVLLDVRMPGMSGLELQETMVKQNIDLPVIIMTGHGDVPMAVRAMKWGAADFIEKPFDNEDLLRRIGDVLDQYQERAAQQAAHSEAAQRLSQLTGRERQILDLLVSGRLNKQIAGELEISTRTVEVHRSRIMDKLNARSLSDLVRLTMLSDSV